MWKILELQQQEQKLGKNIFFVQHAMTVSYSYFDLILCTLHTYTVWNIKMGPWQSPPRGGPGNRLNYIFGLRRLSFLIFLCILLIDFCFRCRLWWLLLCWRFLETSVPMFLDNTLANIELHWMLIYKMLSHYFSDILCEYIKHLISAKLLVNVMNKLIHKNT